MYMYSSRIANLYSCLDIYVYISKHRHTGIHMPMCVCMYTSMCMIMDTHMSTCAFYREVSITMFSLMQSLLSEFPEAETSFSSRQEYI